MIPNPITRNLEADVFLLSGTAGVWKDNQFNLTTAFVGHDGPFLEVGGPTPDGYQWVGESVLQQLVVSNIEIPEPAAPNPAHKMQRQPQTVDVLADGHRLPFAARSVGAVFVSAFLDTPYIDERTKEDIGYRAPMIDEASRVLRPGGFLVMQNGNVRNMRRMSAQRLRPKLLKINNLADLGAVPALDEQVAWSHTRSLFVFEKD